MPAVNLTDYRRPEQHSADNATLTGEEILARAKRAVELALRECSAHVTAGETEALTQEIALHAIRRGVRDHATGEMRVSSGAASLSALVLAARSRIVRSREWRDLAGTWKSRAADGGASVQAVDPDLLAEPEPGYELERAIAAQAQRAVQRGEDPEPSAIMRALDGLMERLTLVAEWTPAQQRRARIALAVALDERDATIALTDAAPAMSAFTAAQRASEGRKLVQAIAPGIVATALTEALADTARNLGGSLDESTDAVPRTAGRATLNMAGDRDRMPAPTPVRFTHCDRRPASTCQRPRRTNGEDLVAYLQAVETRTSLRAQRENRITRLAAQHDEHGC